MRRRAAGTLLALALLAPGLAACSGDDASSGDAGGTGDVVRTDDADGTARDDGAAPATPEALEVDWAEADLPLPAGPPGRVAVRDATACDGTWYLTGAVFPDEPDRESRPAAWRSTDGRTWTPLRLAPRGYWAQRHVLSSVACRGDEVVMVGAKEGGAHGNPRVATWYQRPDGAFTDVVAPFSLYGGPEAVDVGSVSAGPTPADGWLIDGNRVFGAAVWVSPDGRDFDLLDRAPRLASDARVDSFAVDHVHDGRAWTVVGSATTPGRVSPAPMAWTSRDGRTWRRQDIVPTEGFGDLERVVADPAGSGDLLAGGLDGQRFGLWRRTGGTWSSAGVFGGVDPEGRAFRGVSGLVTDGAVALAAVSDAVRYSVWTGPADDAAAWRPVTLPVTPDAAGEHVTTLAASDDVVLLVVDDGEQGRVFTTGWPGP